MQMKQSNHVAYHHFVIVQGYQETHHPEHRVSCDPMFLHDRVHDMQIHRVDVYVDDHDDASPTFEDACGGGRLYDVDPVSANSVMADCTINSTS